MTGAMTKGTLVLSPTENVFAAPGQERRGVRRVTRVTLQSTEHQFEELHRDEDGRPAYVGATRDALRFVENL